MPELISMQFLRLETEKFLSERLEARGGVIEITSTSDESFTAKNLPVYSQKGVLR